MGNSNTTVKKYYQSGNIIALKNNRRIRITSYIPNDVKGVQITGNILPLDKTNYNKLYEIMIDPLNAPKYIKTNYKTNKPIDVYLEGDSDEMNTLYRIEIMDM